MKIELSIVAGYLPEWGLYEAIRELIQNGKDAEVELSAPLTVRHRKDTNTLIVENEGCTLPHEALLFGHTTKLDRSDLIGKFGEGLKLALVVLARLGQGVKIRSGSEVWVPSIQRSEKFNANVLTLDIATGRKSENRVQVEVGGVSAEDWETMKHCFLFLLNPRSVEKSCVSTYSGTLLLGDEFKGKVYLKGIFVQNSPKLFYGYDLRDASLDRDRKMVEKYEFAYRCQSIWREALGKRPDLIEGFTRMLDQEAEDLGGLDSWAASMLPQDAKEAVVKTFKERHGESAIPVAGLADSKDIEHLGKKGIVAPKALKAVLEAVLGTTDEVKRNLRNEVVTTYSWGDLSATERDNLERAIALVNEVRKVSIDDVEVVDFRDEKIEGMYKNDKCLFAKRMLGTLQSTLLVLVHEIAHRAGGDGEKSHVATIETIWSELVANLLKPSN